MSRKFWEIQHKEFSQAYLSGSSPYDVLTFHNLEVPHNKLIMDIGVGFGYFIKEMQLQGNTMFGVDIVPEAFNKVKGLCELFLVNDLEEAPPVDLAISHLVMQHCSDNMILHIFKSINLKPDGIFSFQFAFHDDDSLNHYHVPDAVEGDVIDVARSLPRMQEFMGKGGLELVELSAPIYWPATQNVGWYMVKAQRKNENSSIRL